MSWSFGATSVSKDSALSTLTTASENYQKNLEAQDYDLDAAAKEQIDAAVAAAAAIIDSGAAGSVVFNVTLSGHANPEHKPRQGWSNDTVTVAVSSVESPAPQA